MILQLNFKRNAAATEYEAAARPVAQAFAAVPGLLWKIWLLTKTHRRPAGYTSALPAILDVKQFQVLASVPATARGPVGTVAAAHS